MQMNKYDVCITEILDKHIIIRANSKEEAIEIAKDMYKNEEIVLDYNDLTQTEFEIVEG